MSTSGNPDVPAPEPFPIEAVESGVHPSPEPDHSSSTLPGDTANDDVPMDFPRSPSPELPDLKRTPFPPDEASDSEDEDDEVVARLPIYMSSSLFPNINMFQYPLHNNTIEAPEYAVARGKYITTRVKESIGRVEVEVPIDAGTNVWRYERASELGFVQDVNEVNGGMDVEGGYSGRGGDDKKKKKKESSKEKKDKKWGDKMRLRSEVVPSATGYYSGQIYRGALHLHPISKYLQLRTSLQYLDDPKPRYGVYGSDDEDAPKRARPANPGIVNLSQRPIRHDEDNDGSGSIKDFRNKMWSMAQKEAEEDWVPYEWKTGDDPDVLNKLEKMLAPSDKQSRLVCTTKGLDYLDKA